MSGANAVFVLLYLIIALFHGQINAQTCYSCNSASSTVADSCLQYTSGSNMATTSCSNGCFTNTTSNGQVSRGCAGTGFTNGCTYNSNNGIATCTTVCNSESCNGAMKEVNTGCYYCYPSSTDNCQSVTSTTAVTTCPYPSCATTTTYSGGSIVSVQLNCGTYPAYNYTSVISSTQTIVTTQCNSSFCNSGSSSTIAASTSGVQCYSCSASNLNDNTQTATICGSIVNTDSEGTVTCPSGSCSTLATYAGPSNQLQGIVRGCGQSSCLSTGCMNSGGYTTCWSTCQSSNCNGNVTNTARPDSGSCNNAPGISGNMSTLWCLLSFIALTIRF